MIHHSSMLSRSVYFFLYIACTCTGYITLRLLFSITLPLSFNVPFLETVLFLYVPRVRIKWIIIVIVVILFVWWLRRFYSWWSVYYNSTHLIACKLISYVLCISYWNVSGSQRLWKGDMTVLYRWMLIWCLDTF